MRLLVTAMKNEGPFILEWAAYHLSIGVDRFLVYTNDCEDGSDAIWERLAALGYGAHERNDDIRARGVQKTALMKADDHPLVAEAEWLGCLDVDEFINVKHGQGTLDDLFAADQDKKKRDEHYRKAVVFPLRYMPAKKKGNQRDTHYFLLMQKHSTSCLDLLLLYHRFVKGDIHRLRL